MVAKLRKDDAAKQLIGAALCDKYVTSYKQYTVEERVNIISLFNDKVTNIDYFNLVKASLLTAVESNYKSNIDENLIKFVSILKGAGYEARYIYKRLYMDLVRKKEINYDDFKNFLNLFDFKMQKYSVIVVQEKELLECCIKLTKILDDIKIKKLSKRTLPIEIGNIDNGKIALEIQNIETFDEYKAVEETINLVRTFEQFYLFYRNEPQTGLVCYIKINGKYQSLRSEARGIKKSVKTIKKIVSLVNAEKMLDISLRSIETFYKMNRLLDIHNNALEVESPQSSLLSLWSILELILEENKGSKNSRITQIQKMVMPFLKYNYIRGYIESFSEDLRRWSLEDYKNIIGLVEESQVEEEQIYAFLVLDKYLTNRQNIKMKLDSFPLLRYRMYTLENILGSKKAILNMLREHEQKVAWHLQRIYRTRNCIIHDGESLSYAEDLVENLHHYIDELCDGICNVMGKQKNNYSINDAINEMMLRDSIFDAILVEERINNINDIKKVIYYGLEQE